jgi:hypothetical protein
MILNHFSQKYLSTYCIYLTQYYTFACYPVNKWHDRYWKLVSGTNEKSWVWRGHTFQAIKSAGIIGNMVQSGCSLCCILHFDLTGRYQSRRTIVTVNRFYTPTSEASWDQQGFIMSLHKTFLVCLLLAVCVNQAQSGKPNGKSSLMINHTGLIFMQRTVFNNSYVIITSPCTSPLRSALCYSCEYC